MDGLQWRRSWIVFVLTFFQDTLVKQSLEFADRPVFHIHQELNPQLKGIIDARYDDTFKKYHQLSISILKKFGFGKGIMENRITVEVGELVCELGKYDGQSIVPDKLITNCVLNVISSIIFGRRYNAGDEEFEQIIEHVNTFLHESIQIVPVNFLPLLRFIPGFRRKINKNVHCHIKIMEYIERQIKESLSGSVEDENFIKSFVDAEGPDYDNEQLKYTLRDLFLAGSETSSSTLKWALLLLANHQDIQRRLQRELDSVVPRDRLPSLDDRPRLPYAEATILETWRNKTIVPGSLPRLTLADTTVAGCFVPAGTTVIVNLHSVHMDPDVWPNPEAFIPERFLDVNGRVINKDSIMPFSVGRRACLGELLARQEVFLFLTGLLQNFEILPPEGHDAIASTPVTSITVAPAPYNVRFVPRQK